MEWTLAFLLTAAGPVQPLQPPFGLSPDAAASFAAADNAKLPPDRKWFVRYVHLPAQDEKQLDSSVAAMRFIVTSSSRAPNLDKQIPQKIALGLYRLDLAELKWDPTLFDKSAGVGKNPYTLAEVPLVVRGDWLVSQLSDGTRSTLYYDMLYGEKSPKNRDEFLAFWRVDRKKDAEFSLGMIEASSGIAHNKIRWIESYPQPDARMWGTRDFFQLEAGKDPLEAPDGKFKHDAEEWIGSIPKISYSGNVRGHAQSYLLSNGDGVLQQEAPGRIVEDHARTFGHSTIINPGSCHGCHVSGLNKPSINAVRRILQQGVEVFEYSLERQEFIERFHLTDLDKHVTRHNEDFALYVKAATGVSPDEVSPAFKQLILNYVSDVTLERAGLELGVDSDTMRRSIAAASDGGVNVGPYLAGMAHGQKIPRTMWERTYLAAKQYVANWKQSIGQGGPK